METPRIVNEELEQETLTDLLLEEAALDDMIALLSNL